MGQAAGIIGLGIMGSAFSRNMMKNGLRVVGYDIDDGKLDGLAREGLTRAGSPADVARQADVVITSLPSPAAFHAVMTGENGLASSGRAGLVVADTCTLTVEDKQKAFDALAPHDVILLDCPVSGTGAQAANADLAILGSGDEAAFRKAKPILESFSRNAHYVGAFGNGSKTKYVANLLVAIHNVSAAEALVLGQKAGLDPATLLAVLQDGAGNSRMLEMRGPMMVANDYDSKVSATMITQDKDMGIINAFIDGVGAPAPLFKATLDLYKAALSQGLENSDTASVCAVLENMAGMERD
ncbi:MAG: NAD(P)-dependent oxidoreductase [Rhodospirillales bacterium]|nr:NAD(P)-dependent oxidoreductase [Rhodospirillales bacterium]